MLKILKLSGKAGYNEADVSANLIRFDGIELAAEGTAAAVEKDAEGVPTAWRLLKPGTNELTLEGKRVDLVLSADYMDMIINYHNEKGVQIPIDSNHFLKHFADEKGVDESEVLKMIPSGALAMGYGDLQLRADGLWFCNVQFNPLARKMVKEKSFKYFSPVIRGFVDGRLRVTSVAMENEPAINNLDALAASADQRDDRVFKQPKKEKSSMKGLCAALAGLLGMDSLTLSADGDAPEDVVTKINNLKDELPGLRQSTTQHDAFVAEIRDGLKLGADADESAVQGVIRSLKVKADNEENLKSRVDTLALAAEKRDKADVMERGRKEGKIVDSMMPWVETQDSAALSSWLKHAPVVISLGKVDKDKLREGDSIALSAEQKELCKQAGIEEEDFKKNHPETSR